MNLYMRNGLFGKLFKILSSIMIFSMLIVAVLYMSKTEAKASAVSYSLSQEEIIAATNKSAGVADIIMTADDFLGEDERAADYQNIHEYLQYLKDNGIETGNRDNSELLIADMKEEVTEESLDDTSKEDMEALSSVEENDDISDEDESDSAAKKEIDTDDWRLILVNKQNPVPEGYEANLKNINDSLMADERIIDSIVDMLSAAKSDGVDLMICSAYRSYDRQTTLFNNKMNKLMGKGMSYLDAYAVGSMSVTVPGTSEHQLGLALDILTPSYTGMDDGFGETKAGIWLAENAPAYGFILRYPKYKEEITGIIYEPWHFRYVGTDYSEMITELDVTLEEFVSGEY